MTSCRELRACRQRHPFAWLTLLFVLLTAAAGGGTKTEPAVDVAGDWHGAIRTPGQELVVSVHLQRAGKGWEGTIDIPQQGAEGLALEEVVVEGLRVRFEIAGVPGTPTFSGKASGDIIKGTFMQGGATLPFRLEREIGRAHV